MAFKLLATVQLPLQTLLQWIWYSNQTNSFISGDDRKAFALPVSNPSAASPLSPAYEYDDRIPPANPCNLPIPNSLYDEFATEPWHGFRFLEPAAYRLGVDGGAPRDGDFLRTLVFGPNYGHLLLHPSSGMVLSLRSHVMELMERTSAGFKSIEKTRTRGDSTLTFAAHPEEMLIAYGGNSGNFHAHRFDKTGLGKASKIVAKERKASRVEFVQAGQMLAIGGMGYLSTYSYSSGKFAPLHDISISVRDFVWANDGKLVLVNQGLHGIAAYQYDQSGFTKIGTIQPPGAAREIAVSKDSKYIGVLVQDSSVVSVYSISKD